MKSLLWLLGLFAAAVAVTLAARNAGYVQIVYPPYKIEISLTLFVFALLSIFVLGYLLVRLLWWRARRKRGFAGGPRTLLSELSRIRCCRAPVFGERRF